MFVNEFESYEEDIWVEIAKYLEGRWLVMLAATCKWFYRLIMEESVWRFACLRDLGVPITGDVSFKWIKLYASAFDWMRIGAFSVNSPAALLTDSLTYPRNLPREDTAEKTLQSSGLCVLTNIKTGIWIAGTMQTLDTRHIELFLSKGYQDGSWGYTLVGSHETRKHVDGACGAVFDLDHIKDSSTAELFDVKSWVGKNDDWQPKTKLTPHAVAVCTNLQDNEGKSILTALASGDFLYTWFLVSTNF
ncbi:hypothetical protein Ancab_037993 [Ancistrocladus abbreviatus]